jgi:hypothetical protein
MANSNISSIGRFSSQMLTYLGTQRTVKTITSASANTFKYATGSAVFPGPGAAAQSALGVGVTGSYPLSDYNSTKCYFLSRGATHVYADAMTGLTIDIASMLGISTESLLVQSEVNGQTLLSPDAYRSFNLLRDSGNQIGTVTSISNKDSLQARQIRS